MVFQNYALYPHMTVADNMAFSLKLRGAPQGRDRRRASSAPPTSSASAPLSRPLSAPAFRRPAPARRHGPRHRARSAGVPVRRAAVEPRRQAARADAHRDQGTAPAAQDHDGLRHPRPDRGDDHGRQDRRDARRPGRADRRAARSLRPAGQSVRRRLHRLAGDEFPARARSRPTAAPVSKARAACSLPLDAAPAGMRRPARDLRHAARAFHASPTTAPRPRSQVVEPTGSEIQVVAKLGGEDIIAVFRERHQFKPGDKIRLKPDPRARPSVRRGDGTTTDTHKSKHNGRNDHDDIHPPRSGEGRHGAAARPAR